MLDNLLAVTGLIPCDLHMACSGVCPTEASSGGDAPVHRLERASGGVVWFAP